jgi:hypothetical protein
MTEVIQEEVSQADLPPEEHFVDAGYVSARVLVKSQERFGTLVGGPVSVDTQWQAQSTSGSDASQFLLDWKPQQATGTASEKPAAVGPRSAASPILT